MTLGAPEPITAEHQLDHFESGNDMLDRWLWQRALSNQTSGASRTYVVAEKRIVAGYYCLSSAALAVSEAPGALKRNMPDPIPMTLMGRLAVSKDWQGKGLGLALLRDAVERSARAASIVGIRGVMVHAISEEAKAFYVRHGFTASPKQPMLLVLSLKGLVS